MIGKSLASIVILVCTAQLAFADWAVDLSRRNQAMQKQDMGYPEMPGNQNEPAKGFLTSLLKPSPPSQEIVIMNTEKGFIPSTLRVQKNQSYKVHVVNINKEEKNISFVMDAFSEHHATYFGVVKTFYIEPKAEGVFEYQCPETSAQGKLVVYRSQSSEPVPSLSLRQPASE